MNTNWLKTLNTLIPYLEYFSLSKECRNSWPSHRHNHNTLELHIILQGSCKIEVESEIINITEGQGFLLRANAFHCSLETSTPFLRFSISFLLENELLLFTNSNLEKPYILFQTTPSMRQICYEIFNEYDKTVAYMKQEMISSLLSQLIIHMFRNISQNNLPYKNTDLPIHMMFQTIDCFFSIPLEPIEKDFSRKNLAASLHCSERQLNRLIYKLYGITFQEKRMQARMDYAKFLLRNTNKTITEICQLVGYSDESTFRKFFKSNSNMTPHEFRRSYKKT